MLLHENERDPQTPRNVPSSYEWWGEPRGLLENEGARAITFLPGFDQVVSINHTRDLSSAAAGT
jgi:hypothetical protein